MQDFMFFLFVASHRERRIVVLVCASPEANVAWKKLRHVSFVSRYRTNGVWKLLREVDDAPCIHSEDTFSFPS